MITRNNDNKMKFRKPKWGKHKQEQRTKYIAIVKTDTEQRNIRGNLSNAQAKAYQISFSIYSFRSFCIFKL